jgi:predicted SprT family Zn-dependent metalloprotease
VSQSDDRRQASGDVRVPDPVPDVPLPAGNDLDVVREWARRVMDSLGLTDWAFGFDNARRRMGCCHHRTRTITLSRHFVARNGSVEIKETLLHEIAHCLAGSGAGHGPAWRAVARRIGCRPFRCGQADMPQGRWQALCGCGRRFHRHRRPRTGRRMWCRRCGPDRGLLEWRLDDGKGAGHA